MWQKRATRAFSLPLDGFCKLTFSSEIDNLVFEELIETDSDIRFSYSLSFWAYARQINQGFL